MTSAQDARSQGAAGGGDSQQDRTEILELLAEAGLGQGHGIEWLLDRLTTTGTGR
ncbi:MAG: hypothetical protein VX874_08410 [Pseudomonadota bacterium]|nr:hypothetical protein [Pseudomonadota bacterium]